MGKDIDVAKLLPKQLDEYVREEHTQEECIGFIDGFEKAIDLVKNGYLHAVSQCNAQDYARFCVECDRENLPLLCFSDWVKQYGG